MSLSKKQRKIAKEILKEKPKLCILEGAVRSGKTILNNFLFGLYAGANHGRGLNYIITGHTLGSVKRNVIEPLSEMWGYDLKLDNNGNCTFMGNKLNCFGSDRADSYKAMTGMTAHGWYGNEVTLQHNNTIQEAFSRVSGENAFTLWDTNPDFPDHPIKVEYIDKSGERLHSGRLRIKSWHFSLEDNPYLPEDYIENLKAMTPPGMWYDRRIKGLWVAAEGLVYENFNKEIHVIEPFDIPNDWQRIRSIDFGYENPFVSLWGAIDHDGRLYIYDEYYKANTLIEDHVKELNRYGDIRKTVADHDAQERAELINKGIRTSPAKKAVTLGIQKVSERLVKAKDGKPRVMFFNTCKSTLSEIVRYRWQDRQEGKPVKEEPIKVNDHAMDALRYMIMELDYNSVPQISGVLKR